MKEIVKKYVVIFLSIFCLTLIAVVGLQHIIINAQISLIGARDKDMYSTLYYIQEIKEKLNKHSNRDTKMKGDRNYEKNIIHTNFCWSNFIA